MSQRFEPLLARLRVLLLGSAYAAGVLWFWLGSNEVFEGPKAQGALIYALALAACAWPLLATRLPWAWARERRALGVGGLLLAATLLSLLGGAASLPANLALEVERSLPVLVAAFSALVFWLEDEEARRRVLFIFFTAHIVLLYYGAIQLLDQSWGQSHGVTIDIIRWVRFGESRVYSTLGNPDYMAAHLTLVLGLWLGLGWRRLDPRGPAAAAAGALLLVPFVLVPVAYGPQVLGGFVKMMGPWIGINAALLLLNLRRAPVRAQQASAAQTMFRLGLSARAAWTLLLGLLGLLVLVAQGRGAWLALGASALVMAGAGAALGGLAFFRQRWQILRWPLAAVLGGLLFVAGLLAARAAQPLAPWTGQGLRARVLVTVDSLGYRLTHIFDKADDAQVIRRFYWQSALELGLSHPLLGIGYGNHALFTAKAQSAVWKRWDAAGDPRSKLVEPHVELYTHNDFLQNFAETGALGLLAFLLFWGYFIREAWREARDGAAMGQPQRLELGLGLLALAVAFTANAMTNFPWRVLATQQLCWLAFAVLAIARRSPADAGQVQALPPAPKPVKVEALLIGLGLALWLALFPARWFTASLLFKAGNGFKDSGDAPTQVKGLPFYEKAVQAGLSGTQRVELYLYLGSLYNQAGQPDKAEHWFREGIRLYPEFLEAWYNIGYTYQNRFNQTKAPADLQTALDAYQHVVDVDPRSSNALNNLGNLYYQTNDLAHCRELYERLLRYDPKSLEAHYNLAAVLVRQGDRQGATAQLAQALELKPDFAPALQLLTQLKALPPAYKLKPH